MTQTHSRHIKRKERECLKACTVGEDNFETELLANIMPVVSDIAYLTQMFLCLTMCADTAVCACVYYQSLMLAAPCSFRCVSSGQLVLRYTLCPVAQAPVQISNIWKRDRDEEI